MRTKVLLNYWNTYLLLIILTVFVFSLTIENTSASSDTTGVVNLDYPINEVKDDCSYKWNCTDWSRCINRVQKRTCINVGTCPGTYKRPSIKRNCAQKLPAQLFDIKLELEKNRIPLDEKLIAWVTFESFGTEPTPVNLTYTILDDSGNGVYSELGEVIVYTEEFIIKNFENLNMGIGEYSLELIVEYSNVTEEFRQNFTIEEEKVPFDSYFAILFITAIIIFFVMVKIITAKREDVKRN